MVELSGSVVRGARFFDHVNGGVVAAPNVRVRTDDGRNYLLLTARRYDVVMADVIRPQHAGSAALYSLEYYTLARQALKPDGVMIQWIDPSLPENQYRMLLRTFLQAFPYATAWADGSFVVGSNRPYPLDRAVLAERLASRGPGAGRAQRTAHPGRRAAPVHGDRRGAAPLRRRRGNRHRRPPLHRVLPLAAGRSPRGRPLPLRARPGPPAAAAPGWPDGARRRRAQPQLAP